MYHMSASSAAVKYKSPRSSDLEKKTATKTKAQRVVVIISNNYYIQNKNITN